MNSPTFKRTELLLGKELMEKIAEKRVILFGVGGVGSWCAESLIRSGIRQLSIVDSDRVCPSNLNRQLMATQSNMGRMKVEALKERLLDINSQAEIKAFEQIYCAETAASFRIDTYDYVIDAIDSLSHKAHLIRETCNRSKAVFFSSMGAALKMDPSRIQVAEFWKVKGCPLAAALRRKLRNGEMPVRKFQCVFSDELLPNRGEATAELDWEDGWTGSKARTNGTLAHTTAIFGFTLAGLLIQSLYTEN